MVINPVGFFATEFPTDIEIQPVLVGPGPDR